MLGFHFSCWAFFWSAVWAVALAMPFFVVLEIVIVFAEFINWVDLSIRSRRLRFDSLKRYLTWHGMHDGLLFIPLISLLFSIAFFVSPFALPGTSPMPEGWSYSFKPVFALFLAPLKIWWLVYVFYAVCMLIGLNAIFAVFMIYRFIGVYSFDSRHPRVFIVVWVGGHVLAFLLGVAVAILVAAHFGWLPMK